MANEEKQQFKCPGDCLKCLPAQRTYCASQHAYSNMKVLDLVMNVLTSMKEQVSTMQGDMLEMAAKIDAMQNNEAVVFNPDMQVHQPDLFSRELAGGEDIAQEGSGARE